MRQVDDLFAGIQISENFKDWALKYLHEVHEKEVDDRSSIYKNLQVTYNETQAKLDNLLDLRIGKLITDAEYTEKKYSLLSEQKELKNKLNDTEYRATNWLELSEKTFNFACYARHWFNEGSLEEKKTILHTIGSDFTLKDGILSLQLEKPYFIIKNADNYEDKNSGELELPEMVELTPQMRNFALQNPSWLPREDSNL